MKKTATAAGDADGEREFPVTQWSLIARAAGSRTTVRQEALQALCQRYWRPVFCYCRRAWSKSPEDAEDVTQAFFLMLLEKQALGDYDRELGRFRPYLKTLLRNFERDRYDYIQALKRGGGRKIVSTSADEERALETCLADPRAADPDRHFDMEWKRGILARAVDRARNAFAGSGRLAKFQVFEAHDLASDGDPPSYAELASRFGIKESDVRNALFEVREKVRAEAREDLAQTVTDRNRLDEEYRELFG